MCYGKRKKPISFEGGQRSSGVTGGQTLKTMLTRYLKQLYNTLKENVVNTELALGSRFAVVELTMESGVPQTH
ncbi:hypothetical protein HOLleu_12604 [Holothuria leucospilota]|uniref:Uncharacterized protein n=1 Tax=Holothuria leucospilota TaxID=206669 RepID=A0A9Q1HDY6_HOLLE|nr:hypothetical protein HOLleu_12604 [Holothuria leucospilota]